MCDQPVIADPDFLGDRLELRHQRRSVIQPLEPGDIFKRGWIERERMGLLIGNHLQPVLERAKPVIAFAQHLRVLFADQPGGGQSIEAGPRAAQPQRGIASAVDQLMGLGEEFDLPNPPAPLLEVEAGAWALGAGVVGADSLGQPSDLGDRPEIEAAPPDERADRGKEALACRHIAGAGPRPDEGSAFPRQCRAFVMGQRGLIGDCQRADLARGTEPQIDSEDVAFVIDMAHQLHQRARHPLRRLARFVAFAARQRGRIVEQDRIDVR